MINSTRQKKLEYFLQIPLNNDDNFTKFIQSLDNHFSSDNFKKEFLDVKQQNFNYIPILKEGKENYPSSMKFKIDFYDDKFLTEVYHKTNEGNIKCELKDMNDIKNVFRINPNVK